MGTEKPGFFGETRFFGFADKAWGLRNRVSGKNLGLQVKIIAETRFLGLEAALYCF